MKTNILKNRLKLKRLEIEVKQYEKQNFGYAPNCIFFDECLDKRNEISEIVLKTDREWWLKWDRFHEEKTKELNVF